MKTRTTFAVALLPALAALLAVPVLAADKPTSYVPHAHTNRHVYGSPISPAIVGHAKRSKGKHTPQRRSSGTVNGDVL